MKVANKKGGKILWGISTSHLLDKNDFYLLLSYEPDVIEFYNYPDIRPIELFCSKHNIQPALHVPTPFTGKKFTRFFPTAPGTKEEIESAIQMTKDTIRCASEINALHVVVHFPTPCPPYSPITTNETNYFFKTICEYANKLNVDILVENLTPHPHFHTQRAYRKLADEYNINLCLDVGHAHLLEPEISVKDFILEWKDKAKSVHLYNLTKDRYPSYGHEIISSRQNQTEGWMDIKNILYDIIKYNSPRSIILEYGAMKPNEIERAAEEWHNFKQKAGLCDDY